MDLNEKEKNQKNLTNKNDKNKKVGSHVFSFSAFTLNENNLKKAVYACARRRAAKPSKPKPAINNANALVSGTDDVKAVGATNSPTNVE